ncbi:MAG: cephalosporin hydroxylase family protein [Nitrospirae bacterium]|nr:cephalosporin hydroxylase family protein [Nitrospirota bacterium]MCL5976724.1 cephalosporin hydroxylase family protein [Nitrospirota bacterium]
MKIKLIQGDMEKEIDIYSAEGLSLMSDLWTKVSCHNRLMYEPTWLGIPIIQFPEDIVMMQELIWKVRPDVIVETGVAHGGSAVLYASILELIGRGRVIGVDVEIRKYNRIAINSHPLSKRIALIEGSSVAENIVAETRERIGKDDKVLVVLDSNHSYDHVLKEMELYSKMVSQDSYMVVMDGAQGLVWDIPNGKPEWKEDNPLKAINNFLSKHPEWEADSYYTRMHITSNPTGFLRRRAV